MKKLALLGALATLLQGASAFAFCRTMTCDPNDPKQHCEIDRNLCVLSGKPLAWPSSCVTIGVQKLGDTKDGYSYEQVADVVEKSFAPWMAADCGNGNPSISVQMIGAIECGVSEYSSDRANANIVIFREDKWPYVGAGNAIGLTTTRFDTKTGDLWDADIELNAYSARLRIGTPNGSDDDLQSVLTHEAGHFLGLSHSSDANATMRAIYDPRTDGTSFRTLEEDDVAGICAVYPPDRQPATTSCENRHGFSEQCAADQPPPSESKGCSVGQGAGTTRGSGGAALGLLAFVGLRLARRRRIV